MEINLFKQRGKKLNVSVIPYKNGFRASMTIKYKNGLTERLQKYSSESPEKAKEKLYKYASEKYYAKLNEVDGVIVFAPETNKQLANVEKDISEKVVAEIKNNLLFENVAKEWLTMNLDKTDKKTSNRTINNNTFEYYRTMTYGYLIKDFGNIKVTDLTLDVLQKKFDQKVNLKFKTLKGLRSILSQILEFSIKKGYIKTNIAEKIELPEYIKPKIDFYNEEQIREFKAICDKDERAIAMLYRTNLSLGLRPEERLWLKME